MSRGFRNKDGSFSWAIVWIVAFQVALAGIVVVACLRSY
jgi:hypothetical protein